MKADGFQKKKKQKGKNLLNGTGETPPVNPTIIDRYNGMETKGDFKNSMVKTLVEMLGGAVIAPALSASLGKISPLAGILLAFGGNYVGDKTGLLRGIAMGTIAHGIAKSKEYREENTTIKDRMNGLKNDWLRTLMLKNTESSSLGNLITNKPKESIEPGNKAALDSLVSNLQKIAEKNNSEQNNNKEESEEVSKLEKWVAEKNPHMQNKNPLKRKIDFTDEEDDPFGDDVDFSRF